MFRKLYEWVMNLARSRHAPAALAGVSFAESSFFPIPPDVMLAPMVLANREKAFLYAGICTIASVLGGMLGYAIGRRWWGQGLAVEAATAAIAWAIETFELTRIHASTDARHIRSQRVMEKLGLRREALRRDKHVDRNGELVDEIVYAVTVGPK